ncbi:site-specific DNA-methyltransferase [Vagococcus carniphilus]|uniref:site-specific DNA-methyltransferase n=1 Tax=Vagococcus carniphilus TaxID=218144 RepID=UPI00288EE524|nr:site-specific DNA-methyltransferase [Vagococcus carniphilus]MDT2830036.1 site-specific DNA-methyltransferase [Vagococcus carniphilus]MDT2838470.1 site-specific DNA-methyltransferase [Vagococcus carniphilus]MDT2855632.1 site-specific DNA-methyltransferase [Vagococcus carniphilus]
MKIEIMPIAELNAAEYNPRIKLEKGMPEYEKLKKSIQEFGFVDPPIFNIQTKNLVGGHQRVQVAKDLGYTQISVSIVDMSVDKEKQLNVALNKISGNWDDEKLALLLSQFTQEEIELSGFELCEADDILANYQYEQDIDKPIIEDSFETTKEYEVIKEPLTRRGQVFKLGRHYLMCGDATNFDEVDKLMQGNKAALVVTDPPYNVAIASDSQELKDLGTDSILNDDMSPDEFNTFLFDTFKSYKHLMNDTAAIYVFHGSSFQREFENAMNENDIFVRSQCIWVKNNAGFGWSQYRWQHEPCFYAHIKNKAPVWFGNRKQTTVWRDDLLEDIPSSIWQISRDDVNKYVHPTQKPLSLLAIPIRNSSKRNDIVVDLFGGSGSTLMTCQELERICYTMELDPKFCDVILKRFEQSTGIKPELLN